MPTYICGKMTGIENYNRERFNHVAQKLRDKGEIVYNPAETIGDDSWTWEDYMKTALTHMLKCNKIYVLKGYETSKGANIEIDLARKLNIEVEFEKFVYADA